MYKRRDWMDRERVLAVMSRDGIGMTFDEIQQKSGLDFATVRLQIEKLRSRKKILRLTLDEGDEAPVLYWIA